MRVRIVFLELTDTGVDLEADVGLDVHGAVFPLLELAVDVVAERGPLGDVVLGVELRVVMRD